MRVAHQSGGKTIFASNDANTDTSTALVPKAPCLSGTRDVTASHLSWKAPDNGGSDIVGYQILRGTTSGGEMVIITNTGSTRTAFDDATADPSVAHYFYVVKAINAVFHRWLPLHDIRRGRGCARVNAGAQSRQEVIR
jgi:hypothetical protein